MKRYKIWKRKTTKQKDRTLGEWWLTVRPPRKTITVVKGWCSPMRDDLLTGELRKYGVHIYNVNTQEHARSLAPQTYWTCEITVKAKSYRNGKISYPAQFAEYLLMSWCQTKSKEITGEKYEVKKPRGGYFHPKNEAWAKRRTDMPPAWNEQPWQYLPHGEGCTA